MANQVPGTIVWRELHAESVEEAQSFYSALFGWDVDEQDMGEMGNYTIFKQGEKMVAGVMKKPNPQAPPHWLDYIYTEDLDDTLNAIREAGGEVLMEAFEITDMGHAAIAADPTGAVFAPYEPTWEEAPSGETPADHTFCWTQVNSTDLEASAGFFAEVFNWTRSDLPGEMKVVAMNAGDVSIMSIAQMPDDSEAPSHFIDYVAVSDVGEYHEKATGLGARGFVGPTEIPGMGTFSVLGDRDGAAIALWTQAE